MGGEVGFTLLVVRSCANISIYRLCASVTLTCILVENISFSCSTYSPMLSSPFVMFPCAVAAARLPSCATPSLTLSLKKLKRWRVVGARGEPKFEGVEGGVEGGFEGDMKVGWRRGEVNRNACVFLNAIVNISVVIRMLTTSFRDIISICWFIFVCLCLCVCVGGCMCQG